MRSKEKINLPEIAEKQRNSKEQIALSIIGLIILGITYLVYEAIMFRLGVDICNKWINRLVLVVIIIGATSIAKGVYVLIKCKKKLRNRN